MNWITGASRTWILIRSDVTDADQTAKVITGRRNVKSCNVVYMIADTSSVPSVLIYPASILMIGANNTSIIKRLLKCLSR
jgi:hypothetical protein